MARTLDTVPVCDRYTRDYRRAYVDGSFTGYGKHELAKHYGTWQQAVDAGWYCYSCDRGLMYLNARDHSVTMAHY